MPVYCYSLLVFVLHAIPGHALAAPGLGRGEGAWPIGGGGGGGCRPGPSHRLVFGVEQLDCVTHPRFWPKKKEVLLVDKALQLFRILSLDLEKPLTKHTCSPIYFHNILSCFYTLYQNFANCTTTFTLVP